MMSPCHHTNRGTLQLSITLLTIIFFHIAPQYILITKDALPFLQLFIITFNITTFFAYLQLLLTMANKGFVEDGNCSDQMLNKIARFKKYCYRCKTFRPERSHHCSKCNRCVKKMDHHCFWVNTCVNHDNLAHFIRFLFFACIATVELVIYLSYAVVKGMSMGYYQDNRLGLLFRIGIVVCAIFVSFVTGLFVISQTKLVLKNITCIEKAAVKNLIKYAIPPEHNPYDRGKYTNFVEVFGPPSTLFLFRGSGDGLTYKKTYDIELWPPARGTKRIKSYGNTRVIDMEEV